MLQHYSTCSTSSLHKSTIMSAAYIFTNHETERIRRLRTYIENNVSQKLTINLFVTLTSINKTKLNTGFKLIYGLPIHQFIRDTRMGTAMMLVKNTDKSIKEISIDCGYKHTQTFSKAFKDYFGKSPDHYRRKS